MKKTLLFNPGPGQEIINKGHPVNVVEAHGGWTEVKNFEDYKRSCIFLILNKTLTLL